ncbi:MAG: InlB B-repeat-containing protein, partial [Clostridia bacterium]|nr:InlB B-repeat-containing protein [Clostridia bacterium]
MFSKILSLVLSVCMLITSAPFGPAVDEIGDLFESISQKIADSVDGFVESLGQEDEDTSETTNEKEFVVAEQAAPSEQLVFDIKYITDGGLYGWEPTADYYFVVKGLHSVSQTAARTDSRTNRGSGTSTKFTGSLSVNSTDRGIFYYDKNSSNTLGAANGATSLSTVKFDAACRTIDYSSNNTTSSENSTLSFSATDSNYMKAPTSYKFTKGSSTPYTFTPVSSTPSAQSSNPVTYTATVKSIAAGSGMYGYTTVTLTYTFEFYIDYIWVDSTQLWNLYDYEVNTANRNSASYSSASWTTYQNALNAAKTVLEGGVPQTSINTAYTNLQNAVNALAPKTYTVTYDGNGGTGIPTNQTKTHGVALTLSTTKPTKTGYTFKSWNTKSDGTGTTYASGASYTENADVTLYAQWTVKTYTVSYDANTGTGAPAAQTKTHGVALTLTTNVPTHTGYTFLGWATTSTGTVEYQPGDSYTKDESVTLYARWERKTYTVTYNANGGSGQPANQTKKHGENLTLSTTKPTKTGYTFKNWNTAQNGTGTSYESGATYTANEPLTLYAQWTAKSVTITLDRVGGTGGTASVQATYGSVLPDIVAPTKAGYTFAGYFADDRTTSLTSTVTDKGSYSRIDFKKDGNGWNLTTEGDKGRHISAVITLVDSSLTTAPALQFNDVNLDNSMYQIEEITNGWKYTVDFYITEAMVTAKGSTAYDTNYRFIDIVTTTDSSVITVSSATLGGNMYYDAEGKGVLVSDFETNDTLYARWTTNEYYLNIKGLLDGVESANIGSYGTVDVYVNGVQVADDVIDYYTKHPYGSTYEIKDIKVATGKTFVQSGSNALSGTINVTSGEKTVILKFTTNTYTVSFNGNGNTGGSTASMSMTYGTAKELTANGFTKTGYTFNGWNTMADGTGDSYTNKQSVNNLTATNGATVTLYAQWTAKSVTITLDRVGGTGGTASVQATYGSALPDIVAPTKAGYTFAGYFADD